MSDKKQRQQSLSQQGGSYSNYESIQWNEQSQNDFGSNSLRSALLRDEVFSSETIIQKGDRGNLVRKIQEGLKNVGFTIAVDGSFGNGTAAIVKEFQTTHGIQATGIVDKATYDRLLPNTIASVDIPTSLSSDGGDRMNRMTAITLIGSWLEAQQVHIESLGFMEKMPEAVKVLYTIEAAWKQYIDSGTLPHLPLSPTLTFGDPSPMPLPTELIYQVRPLIAVTEPSGSLLGSDEKSASGIDWNSRLGVPQYRTQSDNLAAPEATCNVTTMAMVLERLGYNRDDVVRALEEKFGLDESSTEEERKIEWQKQADTYLRYVMNDSAAYRRIRGTTWIDRNTRQGLSEQMQDHAQFEDLLDFLVHEMRISRYGIVSEPDSLLRTIIGQENAPRTEMFRARNFDLVKEHVSNCLIAGGAAALSFHHKGTRGPNSTHIVSIIEVLENGLVVDDPYGVVRSDYNPKSYDDAYWSRNSSGSLSTDRDPRKNERMDFNDWTISDAIENGENETKGKESFIRDVQVEKSMNYIQLFFNEKRNQS